MDLYRCAARWLYPAQGSVSERDKEYVVFANRTGPAYVGAATLYINNQNFPVFGCTDIAARDRKSLDNFPSLQHACTSVIGRPGVNGS